MNALEISQLIFNIVATVVFLIVGAFAIAIGAEAMRFVKGVKKLSKTVQEESRHIYSHINRFVEAILSVSAITDILRGKKKK